MIFAAYLAEGPATAWREAVARHARWLGLAARAGAIPLADGRAFHFAWTLVFASVWLRQVRAQI